MAAFVIHPPSAAGPAAATHRDLVVSVVVPLRDRRDRLAAFVERTRRVLEAAFPNHELILCDDGSTDGTTELARELTERDANLRLLVLSRRYGAEIALTAGLDAAIGDFVAVMTPSLQDPPELIPRLVAKAQEGGHDVVYVRKPRAGAEESWPHRLAVRAFHALCRRLTGLDVREDATGFQVLSRRVVNSLARLKEHNRVMRMLFAYVGFNAAAIDPGEDLGAAYRGRGEGLHRRLRLAVDAIVAFSDRPLRYASALSLGLSGLAFLGAVAVVAEKLLSGGTAPGWASLMVVQLGMFCLLFLVLAVVSEYVSRILVETKNRPLYYLREDLGGTARLHIRSIVELE
jgi:polyisoprenyl-phosphate glycosyltransferase